MDKNRKIWIIAILIGVVIVGMVIIRPAPKSIVWESYYTQATFTFSIEPEVINNRWYITETENIIITLNVLVEAKNPFSKQYEYITEVVVVIEPFNRQSEEVARFTPVEGYVKFEIKGEFPNENNYFRIKVGVSTTNHPDLEWNFMEFNMKGLYYPYADILTGEWVAIGALDTGEADTTTTDGNGNGDYGVIPEGAPFMPITFLIGTLILLAKKRKREVQDA